MWLVSNIFVTKAVDSIDAYAHLGGDAAAFASHGKDAEGVRLLNKIDIDGLHTLGHTVIDWLGVRWVCQSVLPGIFVRHREDALTSVETSPSPALPTTADGTVESEKSDWVDLSKSPGEPTSVSRTEIDPARALDNPLIVYGSDSEDPLALHWEPTSHKLLERLAAVCRSAEHTAVDAKGIERRFWTSVDVKILKGTDGRRYALDLPRLCPVDIEWLDHDYRGEVQNAGAHGVVDYPHRVTLLRPELLDAYWETEFRRWSSAKADVPNAESPNDSADSKKVSTSADAIDTKAPGGASGSSKGSSPELDLSPSEHFELAFNMDAFVDHAPVKHQEDSDKPQRSPAHCDEKQAGVCAVRSASKFLRSSAIPNLVDDLLNGTIQGIMDGAALTRLLHGRGINMRYMGHLLGQMDQRADNSGVADKGLALLKPFKVCLKVCGEIRLTSRRPFVRRSFCVHLGIPCAVSSSVCFRSTRHVQSRTF